MHLQRLFEIVYLLLYRKKVTAKELAERFEVSTRTIYRDIDTLSAARIPIYTNKGKDGGIFLMEHFILNRALLSEEEQQLILSALKGVQTITDDTNDTLERMRTLFHQQETDWIAMDLSASSLKPYEMLFRYAMPFPSPIVAVTVSKPNVMPILSNFGLKNILGI